MLLALLSIENKKNLHFPTEPLFSEHAFSTETSSWSPRFDGILQMIVCLLVKFLSCADSIWGSVASRPQQHVSSSGFSLQQELCLQAGHSIVTAARWERNRYVSHQQLEKWLKQEPLLGTFNVSRVSLESESCWYSRGLLWVEAGVRIGVSVGGRRDVSYPVFLFLDRLVHHVDLTWQQVEGGGHRQLQRDTGFLLTYVYTDIAFV